MPYGIVATTGYFHFGLRLRAVLLVTFNAQERRLFKKFELPGGVLSSWVTTDNELLVNTHTGSFLLKDKESSLAREVQTALVADLPDACVQSLVAVNCGRMPIPSIPHTSSRHARRNPPRRAVRRPPRDPAATRRDRARAQRLTTSSCPAAPCTTRVFDDRDYPYAVNPQFKAVARHRCAGQLAGVHAGAKPKLVFLQPHDYWHAVPAAPNGYWTEHFDIVVIREPEEARAAFAGQRHARCAILGGRRARWASTAPTRRTTPTWSFPSSSTSARSDALRNRDDARGDAHRRAGAPRRRTRVPRQRQRVRHPPRVLPGRGPGRERPALRTSSRSTARRGAALCAATACHPDRCAVSSTPARVMVATPATSPAPIRRNRTISSR